ncbi:Coiled-coil domain-containing protein 40 [Boothiomyces macroporosus]|uniref:Coiled-coil domain-containing protein 40 n=1 Tax=Boothiomyces macroporosus TaxID=261099 RepID=A0AAD5UM08_9FUNG|nr:Coiled-coil domain-containing protein 40 [Boothiomyces macroporosus]
MDSQEDMNSAENRLEEAQDIVQEQSDFGQTDATTEDLNDVENMEQEQPAVIEPQISTEQQSVDIPIAQLPPLPNSDTQKMHSERENLEHYVLENPFVPSEHYVLENPLVPPEENVNSLPIQADDEANSAEKEKPTVKFELPAEVNPSNVDDLDDDEDEIMPSDHPLLQRVQQAIYNQLSKYEQKLVLDVREKEEQRNKEIKKREDAGVELYTLQQQLARLQAMYEGAEENYGIIKGLRTDAERLLKHTKSDYQKEQDKLKQHTKNMEQHQAELEKISRTLKQVDLFGEELRSKILVAKRTTLKAEKDIIKQEIEKKRQDFYIDHLTEHLKKLQEKRMTYDSQILVQQKETQAAIQTLHEASVEMQAIQFEKRQLLNQWKSSLIGLKKREEMLQEIESAIIKNETALNIMNTEIYGFKRTLRQCQNEGESLQSLLSKLEGEIEYIKRQITLVKEQREKVSESYSVYMKSLNQIEQELQASQQERVAVQMEVNQVQKLTALNAVKTQKLDKEIAEKLKLQLSFQKGAQGSLKDGAKLRQIIHEKEAAAANFHNELSLINLEALNAEERIKTIKEQLKAVDAEMAEKNQLIGKYEQEIRQNNDLLSKKASEMDSLNKKYDQMTSGSQDAHMGPLEATIYNLTKAIQQKESEILELQQYWLKAQNEMVTIGKNSLDITDEIQNLRMRLTVLNRKKMVVNNAFDTEEKQIKESNRNIKQLQIDMVKVNALLSKQSSVYEKIEESNLEIEQKFRGKLKDAELESIQLEAQLEKIKQEKEEALVGLIEAERQMMLWEKKIQLAKETQSALDPNVGATEIKEMSLEIHRMTLRYASMLKLQEKMIAEMEKSVYRRESISSKGTSKPKGSSQITLQKAIIDLQKKVQQAVKDVKECEQDKVDLEQSHDILKEQIEESIASFKALERKKTDLDIEYDKLAAKKQMVTNSTFVFQKAQRRYQDLKDGKYVFFQPDIESRIPDTGRYQSRCLKIQQLLRDIQVEAPYKVKNVADQMGWFVENTMSEMMAL